MKQPLDLFPARIAIGMFYDQAGKRVDVTMTPEFFRALRDVLQRIGGPTSDANLDEALVETFSPLALSADAASTGLSMEMVIAPVVAAYIDQKIQEMVLQMMPRRDDMSEMTMVQ